MTVNLRGRAARIPAVLTTVSAVVVLALATAGPAFANTNDLKDGACGYLQLTNKTSEHVNSEGLGYDVQLGGASTQWCIGAVSPGVIKFHQRVNGSQSSRVLAESGGNIIYLDTNVSGASNQKFSMSGTTSADDLGMGTSPYRLLYTYGADADLVRTAGNPPSGTWTDFWFDCQENCF